MDYKYIIISSPSGGGKTTICNMLTREEESPLYGNASFSISATTRQKRTHETNGKEYFFHTKEEFEEMIKQGEFLEYATICGNHYGTPLKGISQNSHTLFDIDHQGFEQILAKKPNKVLSIFLLPPSLHELRKRLEFRGDISNDIINQRMENAVEEISKSQKYRYILVNKDLQTTFKTVCSIIQFELENNTQNKFQILAQSIKRCKISEIDTFLTEAAKITELCI